MATRSVCNEPGCPAFAVRRGKCERHATATQQTYDRARGSRQERGYDRGWERVRELVLERDRHECQVRGPRCKRWATTVDHRIRLVDGGARLDPLNLRAACVPCNYGQRDQRAAAADIPRETSPTMKGAKP